MVANLSSHKRGWDDRWEEFSDWAERGQALKADLLKLVDDDTRAFQRVMAALAMPKATPGEKAARKEALGLANQAAIDVPYRTMQRAAACFDLLEAMARDGNPASASDAGVGALAANAAVRGAWLNVRTNLAGVAETAAIREMLSEGERLAERAAEGERRVLQIVEGKFASKG